MAEKSLRAMWAAFALVDGPAPFYAEVQGRVGDSDEPYLRLRFDTIADATAWMMAADPSRTSGVRTWGGSTTG